MNCNGFSLCGLSVFFIGRIRDEEMFVNTRIVWSVHVIPNHVNSCSEWKQFSMSFPYHVYPKPHPNNFKISGLKDLWVMKNIYNVIGIFVPRFNEVEEGGI